MPNQKGIIRLSPNPRSVEMILVPVVVVRSTRNAVVDNVSLNTELRLKSPPNNRYAVYFLISAKQPRINKLT